jgi:hypothetical protein
MYRHLSFIMSSLYSSLPTKSYSLHEFVAYASALKDGNADAFRRFILTGEVENDHQAVLDPIRNVLEDDHPIALARDYDSMITFQSNIVVDCPISVYPVPNPAEVLSTSVHLKYPIIQGDVSKLQPAQVSILLMFYRQQRLYLFTEFLTSNLRTGIYAT